MIISHYKRSPIAWAPDILSDCINKYTNHQSYVNQKFDSSDIIHYHNKYIKFIDLKLLNINIKDVINKPSFILYHSFPEIVDNYNKIIALNYPAILAFKLFRRKSPSIFFDYSKKSIANLILKKKKIDVYQMVVGQYQATLDEYKNYKVVRNIIDFNQSLYNLKPLKSNNIKIGYSPSITINNKRRSIWEDKGYDKTIDILKKISQKTGIGYDIITDCSLEECINRKSKCNIIIDECVTPSFHRSGLEGLALGKMTICSLNDNVIDTLKRTSKSNIIPFENIWIDNLENELGKIIDLGPDYINNKGNENRKWMENYWDPIDITKEYIKFYEDKI